MPKKVRSSRPLTNRYKKQNGLHHGHSKKYLKVYWPYLPVLFFMIIGVVASFIIIGVKPDLSGTTNVSTASLLSATNDTRIDANQQPLQLNSALATAAQTKADNMVSLNYWGHNSPDGQTPWDFIQAAGYQFQQAGENLAYGFSTGENILSAWMNSAEHRANILNASYTNVGFGIAHSNNYQGKGPQTIVVALYASPAGAVSSATTKNNLGGSSVYNSVSTIEPSSQTVSRVSFFAYGYSSWIVFASGLLGGAIVMYLAVKHGLQLKKWAVEGESLVIKHPYLDVVLVIVVVGCAILNQTVGLIN